MVKRAGVWMLAAVGALLTAPTFGQDDFACEVDGDGVYIDWVQPPPIAIADPLKLFRNGEFRGEYPPEEFHVFEKDVPPGEYLYELVSGLSEEEFELVASCAVTVETGFGVRCHVVRHMVSVDWDPLPIDIAIDGFVVRRNREDIATVDAETFSFLDAPGTGGEHHYTVLAVVAGGEERFLVGSCDVRVEFGEPVPAPLDVECHIQEKEPECVLVTWTNPVEYEQIVVAKDGREFARLEGDAMSVIDNEPGPGVHVYNIVAWIADESSVPIACFVDLGGISDAVRLSLDPILPIRLPSPGPGQRPPELPPVSSSVRVLLENDFAVGGWSFGLCADPAHLVAAGVDLDDTVTANLTGADDFVAYDTMDGGLTMEVVVGGVKSWPQPSGAHPHAVLNAHFSPGPEAVLGEVYEVEFCSHLGEPVVAVTAVIPDGTVVPRARGGLVLAEKSAPFQRGDVNDDGSVNVSDAIFELNWLFQDGAPPVCLDTADVNGDGGRNIADPTYLLNYLFASGSPPVEPFAECGTAPSGGVACRQTSCPPEEAP